MLIIYVIFLINLVNIKGEELIKKILTKLCVLGILVTVSGNMNVYASEINNNSDLKGDTESNSELESNPDNITTDNNDIDIKSTDEVKEDTDLKQIGDDTYDDSLLENKGQGSATIKAQIVIDNIAIPIFPTYDDPTKAMEKVKQDCSQVLEVLQGAYSLNDFSTDTWNDYYNDMNEYLNNPNKVNWYNENNAEYSELSTFFDIYENTDVNNALISTAANAKSITDLVSNSEFIYNLPYTSVDDLIKDGLIQRDEKGNLKTEMSSHKNSSSNKFASKMNFSITNNTLSSPSLKLMSFNSNAAIQYAQTYANSYNPNFGHASSDCTNFASPIMLSAGKIYTPLWLTAQVAGTWHYTDAWANANSFANYWGVNSTCSTHKAFSYGLQTGNFITEDKAGDKSWDHIGFVVAKGGTYSSSLGYTDYEVAQHTSDYCAWASSSTCNWDQLKASNPNCIFGVIRVS